MGATADDLPAQKQRLLAEARADLLKRQLSNTENYDKAILSLATAFLGFSFAFLKDVIPGRLPHHVVVLYLSWGSLASAVVATIVSFWVSHHGIKIQLKKAEAYYLRDDPTALAESREAKAVEWINYLSGGLFILGLVLTTAFVISNFEHRSSTMSGDSDKSVPLGATIPRMQEVPQTKGATIPTLQPVQSPQPQAQPAQGTESSTGGAGQGSGDKR